jgi:outer membrane protein OmpU
LFVITKTTKGVKMTNLKKIGLTALAGTLAATTFAQAVELSVNGTARMEYETKTADATGAETVNSDLFTQTQ